MTTPLDATHSNASTHTHSSANSNAKSKWNLHDTQWTLSLFGTAVGAGILFLPINIGIGGFWPLIIMACLAFPMTFLAHRGLARFVLSSKNKHADFMGVSSPQLPKRHKMEFQKMYKSQSSLKMYKFHNNMYQYHLYHQLNQ